MQPARRRPGTVRDAIVDYLKSRPGSVAVSGIYEGVKGRLGEDLPQSSVRSSLRLNTGTLFERVSRGRYQLRTV